LEEDDLPDLIVIDGGKGQLSTAVAVLRELAVETVGVVALAKERRSKGTTERLYVSGRKEPLPLPQDSPESLYLQRVRDEAHRFAVSYHRQLRKRQTLRTGLEGIPGVGKKRRQALIDRFGTLKKIREAPEEEIARVVGEKLAARVREKLASSSPEL
jgi:excinuclease ABC subunit C